MKGVAILALVLALLSSSHARAAQEPARSVLDRIGFDQRLGEKLPLDLRFRDEQGRDVRLGDCSEGRPVVLALVYYECPMLCTLVLNGLVRALRAIDLDVGRDVTVVAISIDPTETPELARAKKTHYAEAYGREGSEPGWRFLVGGESEIRAVADAIGFRYAYLPEKGEYAHASGVVCVTPDGVLARYFYGVEYSARDLRLGLVEASHGRVGTLADKVLLYCFHYDPATGRYGFAILGGIRILGAATVIGLAGAILVLLARDRRRMRAATGAEA